MKIKASIKAAEQIINIPDREIVGMTKENLDKYINSKYIGAFITLYGIPSYEILDNTYSDTVNEAYKQIVSKLSIEEVNFLKDYYQDNLQL